MKKVHAEFAFAAGILAFAASRDMIFDGQLDPAFLRQIELTVDFEHGRAWARLDKKE